MSGVEQFPEIDVIAQAIRVADGNHRLGAGALAEALMPTIETIVAQHVALALNDASFRIVREAGLLAPPSGGHPAVTWLREEAKRVTTPPAGSLGVRDAD